MKIALDTNRYMDAARGDAQVMERLRTAERIFMPLFVLAELRAGFSAGARASENERVLRRFLATARVSVLLPDEQTTRHYALLYAQLRRQGTPIPINDIWIAALTLQHGLHLYTRDGHFDHLPQLPRV